MESEIYATISELGLGETSFPDCHKIAFRNARMLAGSFVTPLDRAPGKLSSQFANKVRTLDPA
jgi:hypothetical protein